MRIMLLLTVLLAACSLPRAPAQDAVRRGLEYLASRQSDDGAWRSQQVRALSDGVSLTPVVLKALSFADSQGSPGRKPEEPLSRGLDFLARASADQDLPFPVYTCATAAIVLRRAGRPEAGRWLERVERLQMVDELGWHPGDPEYGGWGEAVVSPRRPSGTVPANDSNAPNLSATLFAVGALRLAGPPQGPAYGRALSFVHRCQNFPGDGGFFFSPTAPHQNKAGGRNSYGTTTADGLRALRACGEAPDSPRVQAARRWLLDHFDAERVPGPFPHQEGDSLYYYWCWTAAHALRESPGPWKGQLSGALVARQRADGSWANPHRDMLEDEPLIATSFAVAALTLCASP